MINTAGTRIAAAIGLLHVFLVFIGVAVHNGSPDVGASPHDVMRYAATLPATRAWVGNIVECVGYLLFLPFAAYLSTVLSPTARPWRWLSVTALSAAAVYIAVSVAPGIALQEATVQWGKRGLDPQVVAALSDIADDVFFISFLPATLFLGAVAALALKIGGAAHWPGVSAALVGVVLLITGVIANFPSTHGSAVIGFLVFVAWIVVISVTLIVRPHFLEGSNRGLA